MLKKIWCILILISLIPFPALSAGEGSGLETKVSRTIKVSDDVSFEKNLGPFAPDYQTGFLRVKSHTSPNFNRKALLKFEVEEIPLNAIGATVKLYAYGDMDQDLLGDDDTVRYYVDAIGMDSSDWEEDTIHSNPSGDASYFKNYDTWGNGVFLDSDYFVGGKANEKKAKWCSFDITDFYMDKALEGFSHITVSLETAIPHGSTQSNMFRFHSKEKTPANAAYIEIEYLMPHENVTKDNLHLYLFIGDSNMAGRAPVESADEQVNEKAFLLNSSDVWEEARAGKLEHKSYVEGYNRYSSIEDPDLFNGMNPVYNFVKMVNARVPQVYTGLIVNASSNSTVDDWQKGAGTSFYEEAIRRTQIAMESGTLKGVIWHQGEEDIGNTSDYLTGLADLVSDLRTDLGVNVPFIAGQLFEKAEHQSFNSMISNISETIPNASFVSSASLTALSGSVHFDRKSQLVLGGRYASKVLDLVYNDHNPIGESALLNSLLVDGYDMNEDFDVQVKSYIVYIDESVNTMPEITASASDNAVVHIAPAYDVNSASQLERTAVIRVTSENGTTEESFTILFNKASHGLPQVVRSVKIYPQADTYISISGGPYGASPTLTARSYSGSPAYTIRGLMRFDLSDYSDKEIISAGVNVYAWADGWDENGNITGTIARDLLLFTHEDNNWSEDTLVGKREPANSNEVSVLTFPGTNKVLQGRVNLPEDKTPVWCAYDISGLVVGNTMGDGVIGVSLEGTVPAVSMETSYTLRISSKESSSNKPYILLEYMDEAGNDARLQSLLVKDSQLAPTFNSDTLAYEVKLPYGTVSAPAITATAYDGNAFTAINYPQDITSSDMEKRTAEVRVVSESRIERKTYKIVFSVYTLEETRQQVTETLNTAVRNEIPDILERHHSILNININGSYALLNQAGKNMVHKALEEAEFTSWQDVEYIFNRAVEQAERDTTTVSPPPPSANKGGGGGTPSVSVPYIPIEIPAQNPNLNIPRFNDLAGVAWAEEAITELSKMGIVNGVAEEIFRPDDNVTREQFITMLIKAFGMTVTGAQASFTDVDNSDWYGIYIASAQAHGITNGRGNNEFGIGTFITREEMAVMAYRTLVASGISIDTAQKELAFTDIHKIKSYSMESVERLSSLKIINGMGDGSFEPESMSTRAMAAKVVYMLTKLGDGKGE